MSDSKDHPRVEQVGSDMAKVGAQALISDVIHQGATDEYYRLSKSCPSLSFP
jgi:hypothetical protein